MSSNYEFTQSEDDEFGLVEVFEFLQAGWKVLSVFALVGALGGLAASIALPARYEATASLEPARVLGQSVESIQVLAEKLNSPTYYSGATIAQCGLGHQVDGARALATALKPTIGRQSAFVSVTFKAESPRAAAACLGAVLGDVNRNQGEVSALQIQQATARIRKDEERLAIAQDFVATVAGRPSILNASDARFSAASLLIVTLNAKQDEVSELKEKINSARLALAEPQTRPAAFATPIYTPSTQSGPKTGALIGLGTFAGGVTGIALLLARRAFTGSRRQRLQRPALVDMHRQAVHR